MKNLNEELRAILLSRSVIAVEIAKKARVSHTTISRFISGKRGLRAETLARVIDAAGLRLCIEDAELGPDRVAYAAAFANWCTKVGYNLHLVLKRLDSEFPMYCADAISGEFLIVNTAYAKLFGELGATEFIGHYFRCDEVYLHPRAHEGFRQVVAHNRSNRQSNVFELARAPHERCFVAESACLLTPHARELEGGASVSRTAGFLPLLFNSVDVTNHALEKEQTANRAAAYREVLDDPRNRIGAHEILLSGETAIISSMTATAKSLLGVDEKNSGAIIGSEVSVLLPQAERASAAARVVDKFYKRQPLTLDGTSVMSLNWSELSKPMLLSGV